MKIIPIPDWVLEVLARLIDPNGSGATRFISDSVQHKELRGEYAANMTAYEVLVCLDKPGLSHDYMIQLYAVYGWINRHWIHDM